MIQLVVVARKLGAFVLAAITYRLRAVALCDHMLINTRRYRESSTGFFTFTLRLRQASQATRVTDVRFWGIERKVVRHGRSSGALRFALARVFCTRVRRHQISASAAITPYRWLALHMQHEADEADKTPAQPAYQEVISPLSLCVCCGDGKAGSPRNEFLLSVPPSQLSRAAQNLPNTYQNNSKSQVGPRQRTLKLLLVCSDCKFNVLNKAVTIRHRSITLKPSRKPNRRHRQ